MYFEGLEKIIIKKCLQLKSGETVLICSNEFTDKLVKNLKQEINRLNGMDVIVKWSDETLIKLLKNTSGREAAERIMPATSQRNFHFLHTTVKADKVIIIIPPIDEYSKFSFVLEKLKTFENTYFSRLYQLERQKIRGILLDYPFNKTTGTSLTGEELSFTTSIYRRAIKVDPEKINLLNKKLFEYFVNGNELLISSTDGSKLKLNIQNRYPCEETGKLVHQTDFCQVPGGEIFIAPEENSAHGKFLSNINSFGIKCWLKFKDGVLTDITGKNKNDILILRDILKHMDLLGERLGEFGIGTNPEAMPFTFGTISEKALGTVHIAIGENRNFGGKNKSNIHLDFISTNNDVFIDGVKIIEQSEIVI